MYNILSAWNLRLNKIKHHVFFNPRVAEHLNLEIQSHELIKHPEYTRFSRSQIYRNWFRL